MFGLFKRTKQINRLTDLLFSQNEILRDFVSILKEMDKKQQQEKDDKLLDILCHEWYCQKLGVCIKIFKEKENYFACIGDIKTLSEDFVKSYPIRFYRGLIYFVLDEYAIFIEYKADIHEIILCGKLSLLREAEETTLYRAIPFEFNPN